jgi:hypothetical protein
MSHIIDEMPTLAQVQVASAHEIVLWQFYLRPTISNDELGVVRAITRKYDAMSPATRESIGRRVRREHG